MNLSPSSLIEFYSQAENLKNTLRHSYTSANRHESVAEHSWMLCLLALAVADQVSFEVDILHLLKLLIVHDLPEAITGDIPVFDKQAVASQAHQDEALAMQKLVSALPQPLQQKFTALFEEYETRQTNEARLAAALDKAEAFMQHNLALNTWTDQDFEYQTNLHHPARKRFEIDPFIIALRDQIDLDTMQHLEAAGLVERAGVDMQKAYRESK
jgi:putative hydrolases of HD superfamily